MSQRKSSFGKVKKGAKVRGSVFSSAVVMEGYLKKHSTGLIKRWQRRYFAVKGHYLSYYDNENMAETELKGTIDLANLQASGLTNDVEGEWQIIVDGVTTMFRADSKSEAQRWVDALQAFKPNPFFQRSAAPKQGGGAVPKAARGSALAGMSSALSDEGTSALKPLVVSVHSASLTGPSVGTATRPTVIVSVKKKTKQHYQIISSPAERPSSAGDSMEAKWTDKLTLAGLPEDVDLVFTIFDWQGGIDGWKGMCQGKVELDKAKWADLLEQQDCVNPGKTKVALGPLSYTPRDGAGKNIQFSEWAGEVGGVLSVEIKPFASTYTMCGELCKTGGDRYTSVWKSRWCLLADGQLQYFGAYGDPKPKKILELKDATSITHPDQILEMIDVQMPDKLWQFKTSDPLLGGQWWWKLRQAAGMETEQSEQSKGISLADTEHANAVGRRVHSSY